MTADTYPSLQFNVRMTNCTTLDPFSSHFQRPGLAITFVVPPWFHSDGASIPRWSRWAIPKWGPHTWAAILHDWLYRQARLGRPECTRAEADRYLRVKSIRDGMRWHTAWLMWAAVRIGGAKHWRQPDLAAGEA